MDDITGYVTDMNLPGSDMGETNGLYAGVTNNPADSSTLYDYLDDNPGDTTSDTSSAASTLGSFGSILGSLGNINAQNNQARATAAQLAAQQQLAMASISKPSLLQQWNAMDTFAKLGAVATIIALSVVVLRGKI